MRPHPSILSIEARELHSAQYQSRCLSRLSEPFSSYRREMSCLSKEGRALQRPHGPKILGTVKLLEHESVSKAALSRVQRSYSVQRKKITAYIALGSNLGNRLQMIEAACNAMDNRDDICIVATSGLWETKAMYVENQPEFLNGVCKIETTLHPMPLLDRLQSIENELGRVKTEDKGPRNIDLDILLYAGAIIDTDRLQIPHKLMLEREFVLRPLAQIDLQLEIPGTGVKVTQHLQNLVGKATPNGSESAAPMSIQTQLSPTQPPLTPLLPWRNTRIMSILNVTPDSFSDGGVHSPSDKISLKETIQAHYDAGATILDVGGQSSRPGAPSITAEEEIARILPAIEAAKETGINMALSVDTYRASVAEAAINAGAHIINDISAGALDPEMLPTVARLGCTFVLMHMRGTPETMLNQENTKYEGGLKSDIVNELYARVRAAEAAGVRRWRMILDPGLGFAKKQPQNLEILRRLHSFRTHHPNLQGIPWLVGTSRKSFVGRITGVQEPKDRTWGTAATVTAAIEGGADIVRVHDVDEMTKVAKMADAIYRDSQPNRTSEK